MTDPAFPCFYPPALPKGGTIGVIAPSRWAEPARLAELKARLEGEGYAVIIHPQNDLRNGWLAGSDEDKLKALHEMFADPTIDAIMCARGGAGAYRLLDKVDYDLIAANPKPFIGFSDVTCLLSAITKKTGMITYHGPMGWREPRYAPQTLQDLLHVIGDKPAKKKLHFPQATIERTGRAKGIMRGGNMALLQVVMGTSYDFRADKTILFLEDVDEPLYVIDRMLSHLRMAGCFEGVQAVLVGDMMLIEDEYPDPNEPPEAWYGKTIKDMFVEHVPADIPLAFDVPCGHDDYVTTFPVGAEVEVDLTSEFLRVSFAP